MDEELERRAGKPPTGPHPFDKATSDDPSDQSDPRVAQPGEDPPGENAMRPLKENEDADR